ALQPPSFDRLPSTADLPLRLFSDSRAFILTNGGWLEVAANTYGGTTFFTTLPNGAWRGIPVLRTQPAPHFIRESSSTQVYLISGGMKQAVANQTEINNISATYGVENKTWIAADGALTGIAG
ncbi:hypothetical protein, partial [Agromyces sp. PvR057]|uniref:hypothetical protein n=1 Tax=Agromyces sp. PvR057 TaxID=3156403 RepID=UPI00339B50F6